MSRSLRAGASRRGQALVEFSLAIVIFLALLMGVLDFGRAIYLNNGVTEAAREIARVTSVHPGSTLGDSPETQAVIDAQKTVVIGLGDPTFSCVTIRGQAVTGTCQPGNWVKVEVDAPYSPATPFFSAFEMTLTSSSSIQIP